MENLENDKLISIVKLLNHHNKKDNKYCIYLFELAKRLPDKAIIKGKTAVDLLKETLNKGA